MKQKTNSQTVYISGGSGEGLTAWLEPSTRDGAGSAGNHTYTLYTNSQTVSNLEHTSTRAQGAVARMVLGSRIGGDHFGNHNFNEHGNDLLFYSAVKKIP